jgi:leucyl aminopeptidase (aminopeptidase T)
MSSLNYAAKIALKVYMGAKRSDKILVIYNSGKEDIAESLFSEAKKIANSCKLIKIPKLKISGEEPSKNIAFEMLKYDIIMLVTSKSLSHTKARRDACKKGSRVASMPGITRDMFIRTMNADYKKMKIITKKLGKILTKGKNVRVITKKGTNLSMSIDGRKSNDTILINTDCSFGNLPSGEACLGPLEGTTNGVLVVNKSFLEKVDKPIRLVIEKGYVVNISGGKTARKLVDILKSIKDKNAYAIAELGIGTNDKAKITGNILEDEKVLGTAHVALGNNMTYGGKINVPIHLDGVFDKPTIFIDDTIIIKNGKILI